MVSVKSAALIASGVTLGCCLVANQSGVTSGMARVVIGLGITSVITTSGALLGMYKGANQGIQVGTEQSRRSIGNGALEIPLGFVIGGFTGSIAYGMAAFALSATISTIALTIL